MWNEPMSRRTSGSLLCAKAADAARLNANVMSRRRMFPLPAYRTSVAHRPRACPATLRILRRVGSVTALERFALASALSVLRDARLRRAPQREVNLLMA